MVNPKGCRVATKKTKVNKNAVTEFEESNAKLSLPILSDETLLCSDDYIMKTLQNSEVVGKNCAIPRIKVKCAALNYEKIIDYKNNNVIIKKPQKVEKVSGKTRRPRTKNERNDKCRSVSKTGSQKKPVAKKSSVSVKKKPAKAHMKNSEPIPELNTSKENKKKNLIKNEQHTSHKKILLSDNSGSTKCTNEGQIYEMSTSESLNHNSSTNMNIDTLNPQSTCSVQILDDEIAFFELQDINLEELLPSLDNISEEEGKMKLEESTNNKNNKNKENGGVNICQKSNGFDHSRLKIHSDINHVVQEISILSKTSLQTAVENFINIPQVAYLKGSTALKRGLCCSWLSNNFVCSNKQCLYNHNALNLFTKKLRQYPSKFIMSVVVSMRHDLLFVDVAMAAFKIISERQIPVVWVTFLTFFVFYVTEPSDSRFLKFWATVARFFCELQKNYSTTNGFASLLSVFSHIQKTEEWKIIEFIKLIKQPPVQVSVNFTLLQPVLKMDLPLEFLTEAVESCIATQKDVLKVYWLIVPKIPIMTLPIENVELLLKLCKTLKEMARKDFADDLKQRLRPKVGSVKTKIPDQKYPLTSSFQKEISTEANEESCVGRLEENCEMDLSFLSSENTYFRPEEDFCNLMAQALEFSPDGVPKPFRNTVKFDGSLHKSAKKEKPTIDVSERQVTRIKQFFRDCQFDLLGKYLNELRPNVIELAAEEFLKLLFRMKISLQQGLDLVKIILLQCKSDSAAKIIASVSITFILNLVRINEWEKAYTLVSLCQEKKISLVEGKVFYVSQLNNVTQCRIVLLLIEIHAYKGNYEVSVELVKKYFLFSANSSLRQLTWKSHDEIIRVRILEDLFLQIISNQLTQVAYDLFMLIWKEQKQLTEPVDLRKFVNEILILLLNTNSEEALNVYEQIKTDCTLNDTTLRSVVVTLVRRNNLSAAKSIVHSTGQNFYLTPQTTSNSTVVKILTYWLEEEIYVVFDAFFDSLISNKTSFNSADYKKVEIQLQESKPNLTSTSGLRPLCLGIITPTLREACSRIERVLQYQFNPPLKLIIMPYYLKLDEFSVQLHLQKRMKNLN